MNSLDFYLALFGGCKRDVARVAVKVGGLTDSVICASVIVIIALFIHSCSARRSVAATQTADQTADVILLREMEFSDGRRYVFEYDEHRRISRRAYYHHNLLVELMAYTYSEDLIRSFDYVMGYYHTDYYPLFRKKDDTISYSMNGSYKIELNADGFPVKHTSGWRSRMLNGWGTIINNFTWENGNLVKANSREFGVGGQSGEFERFDTVAYTYDNMKSPFSLCATPRWFVWWLFDDCSANNVTSKDTAIYEYTYNEYGLRATQKQGSNTITYTYMKQATNSLPLTTFAYEKKMEDEPAASIMTLTTNDSSVHLIMSGTGAVTIDWGDGSEIETAVFNEQQINKTFEHRYTHPDAQSSRTITIKGENITLLHCRYNQIYELDVSQNAALTHLLCTYNKLTLLDVSRNTALQHLDCSYNQLTELILSPSLTYLNCTDNSLTTLDMSQNTSLMYLDISTNQLTCDALNALYDSLHDKDFSKGINISENFGGGGFPCNIDIAKSKGWSVQTIFW